MAKNAFLDWDTTASNNTDVGGIGIQGTNAVSNFDDALRTVMAQLRTGLDGKVVYASKAINYTALAADNNAVHRYSATATVSLTAAATLGANWHYTVIADGGDVTIDPNGAETIDGAATLVIPSGSAAHIICSGTAFFTEKTNVPIQPFATVASAATTDIGAATSQNVTVTGTTTITSFGTVAAGTFRRVVFSGVLTLTHNATSLILPQGGNVVTAAGESLEAVSLGSGNWRVTSYTRVGANGLVSGVAVAASGTAVNFTGATGIPSWAKRITVMWADISTNGTSGIGIQIGPSGGLETSGYNFVLSVSPTASTTHFLAVNSAAAAGVYHGSAIITLLGGSQWVCTTQTGRTDVLGYFAGAGTKTITGSISQLSFKPLNGTDTFDAGSVNIFYE